MRLHFTEYLPCVSTALTGIGVPGGVGWVLWAPRTSLLNPAVCRELAQTLLDPCDQHLLSPFSWVPDGPRSPEGDAGQVPMNYDFIAQACLNSLLDRELNSISSSFFRTALWPWICPGPFKEVGRPFSSGHLTMCLDFHSWPSHTSLIFQGDESGKKPQELIQWWTQEERVTMVPGVSGNLTSISRDQTFRNHTDKVTGEFVVVQGFLFSPRSCNEVAFTYNKLPLFQLCNWMFWPMNVPVKLSPQSRKWTCLSHPEVSSFLEFYVNRTTQRVFFFGLASINRHNYCGFLHFAVDGSTHFITE